MRTNNYNLQFLHHNEVFATRELALTYLTENYKPNSLNAEPVFVKYGNTNNPDVILAFGTSNDGPGSFYVIDLTKTNEDIEGLVTQNQHNEEDIETIKTRLTEIVNASGLNVNPSTSTQITYQPNPNDDIISSAVSIAEAIDLLSSYAQTTFNNIDLTTENTNSTRLVYSVNPSGGKLLKCEINISTYGSSDSLPVNDNIIGIKTDGLYAAAHLSYDNARNELLFTKSGYQDGIFKDDAIVERINLGEHTKILADNVDHSVKITVNENSSNNQVVLSGDVQISSSSDNIAEIEDGKLKVIGTSNRIKHNNTTVQNALTTIDTQISNLETSVEQASKKAHIESLNTNTISTNITTLTDGGSSISSDVKLGSDNTIVVKNGGLETNINIDVNAVTNQLIITLGNQTYTKTLPGASLFESAVYNDTNEELIISFTTGNTIVVPIHNIIHTWETYNQNNSPIVLTKQVITGGVDKLSATINLKSNDNLIGVENGYMYVSENNINSKIQTETTRATTAEQSLQTEITNIRNEVISEGELTDERIQNILSSIETLTQRVTQIEETLNNLIDFGSYSVGLEEYNNNEYNNDYTS